jgi:hypothetical protein
MDDKLRSEMMKDFYAGTPRALRAQRFADTVMSIMRDFIPRDRDCCRRMTETLFEIGWLKNAEIISVPPECDHLDKLELECRRLETHPGFVTATNAPAPAQTSPPSRPAPR